MQSGEVVLSRKMSLCITIQSKGPPIPRTLCVYGVIEDIKFCHWTHMPSVGDGVCIVRMVCRAAILYHMYR